MSILDQAVAHFKKKIEGCKIAIRVPEWDEGKKTVTLYMRPLSCLSSKRATPIYAALEKVTPESAVDILMALATDSPDDTGDHPVFNAGQRQKLLTGVDAKVIDRILTVWIDADKGDTEQLKK